MLPNSVALFERFQTQNRDYLDTLEGTNEKLFGFELGAPPHCEIRCALRLELFISTILGVKI